jgi:DNA (cytosine-5)-methyltransferase 1
VTAAEKLRLKKLRGKKIEKVTSVDLFCGAGGTSTGLAEACKELGKPVELIAVNHWTIAVETHKKNHPWATHYCEAIERINPRKVVPSGRLKLLVASPECTHHSKARGARPMNDQSRAQPWQVLKWCQELYVENLVLENIEEMVDWGPLGADGRPLKSKKGETFRAFISSLESMDYKVEYRILNSADFGDATTRKRLFMLCRRPAHKKIRWPLPSHTRVPEAGDLFQSDLKPWRPAKEIIDWSIEGESIFNRKRPLKNTTLERIAAGLRKFCGPAAEPFLLILRRHMDAMSVDSPLPTICANGNHVALCEPKKDAFILQQQSGGSPRSVSNPVPTIATKGAQSLVEPQPFLIPFYNERKGQKPRTHDLNSPVPSIPATGSGKFAVIEPKAFVVTPGGTDLPGGRSVSEPLPTVMAKDRFAVVEPKAFMIGAGGPEGQGRNPQSIDDPLRTILACDHKAVIQPKAFLVSPAHGEGVDRRAHSLNQPLKSPTCSNEFAVVEPEAFVVSMEHGKSKGKGNKNGKRAYSMKNPLPTITSADGWAMAQPCIIKYNGTGKANSVDEPLDTVTAKDRFGLMIPGVGVVGLDIKFRMLRPHELAAAMGFPKKYQFMGTREQQVRQIGNAVACNTAKALCKALLED